MPFPDRTRAREDIDSAVSGSGEEPPGKPIGTAQPNQPPTIHRGSSSSAHNKVAVEPPAATPPVALPFPGDVIDGFRLEEAIGVGGMGAVFRALTPSSTARSRSSCCPRIKPLTLKSSRGFIRRGGRPPGSITRTSPAFSVSGRTGRSIISPSSTSKA